MTIPLGITPRQFVNATNTAFAFGSLWIPINAHPHGWLIRIDKKTNRVKARIPGGESPDSVAIVGGSVWVANSNGDESRRLVGRNTLSRIDPRTNRVGETVRVEVGGPIAGGFGAVWVMGYETGDGNGTLRKIDARTGRIVAHSRSPGSAIRRLTVSRLLGSRPLGGREVRRHPVEGAGLDFAAPSRRRGARRPGRRGRRGAGRVSGGDLLPLRGDSDRR